MTFLVIDIGSSSVRALLMDGSAQVIHGAVASIAHRFLTDSDGASTADADDLRLKVESCIDSVLSHPDAATIRAVGMATFVGNLMGVSSDGAALTPVYSYADTRSAVDAESLASQIDAADLHRRTGCRPHSSYHPAKLLWLTRTQPDVASSVQRWMDVGMFAYEKWFGRECPCSTSVAAWSGLLNRETVAWDAEILRVLRLDESRLPVLSDYSAPQRGLSAGYASRWPVLADVPFYLAVGDGAAANVGSGAVSAGQMALTLGTTAALRTVSDAPLPVVPSGLWGYRIDALHHLIGGATSEGGNVFEWARQTLNLPAPDIVESALAAAIPDQHGLTAIPLLVGERSPGWAANATATLHGIHLSTTPLDMVQALLESVAYRLALIAEQLGGDGQIYAGGGALHASPAWAQMICNALARPVALLDEPEVTARGVALLTRRTLDGADWSAISPRIRLTLTPESEASDRLRAARQRQAALYGQLYEG